jgi:hypothetical protein
MNEIRNIVEEYEVPYLVHFTRTQNLPLIFEHGIVPRNSLGEIDATINDDLRLDGQLEANSLSIAFPNAKMLWKMRQEHPGSNWSVLVLSRSILWEMPCAFCPHNAAAKEVTSKPIEDFQSATAFKRMFDPLPDVDRDAQKLKKFDPTDVQAEVLAFGTILPEKIIAGVFQRTPSKNQYQHHFGERKVLVHGDRGFFSQRWYHRNGVS